MIFQCCEKCGCAGHEYLIKSARLQTLHEVREMLKKNAVHTAVLSLGAHESDKVVYVSEINSLLEQHIKTQESV